MSKKRSEFKAPKRLDDGRMPDVRDYCEVFKMVAANETDMKFLAHLYRVIFWEGGAVTIQDSNEALTYHFGKYPRGDEKDTPPAT